MENLDVSLCEIIEERAEIEDESVENLYSHTFEEDAGIDFSNALHDQTSLLTQYFTEATKSANTHLSELIIRMKKSHSLAILRIESKYTARINDMGKSMDRLSSELIQAQNAYKVSQEKYGMLLENCGEYISGKLLRNRDRLLLVSTMTHWEGLHRRGTYTHRLGEILSRIYSHKFKVKVFSSWRTYSIQCKCERERDEYVSRLDTIARKVIADCCMFMAIMAFYQTIGKYEADFDLMSQRLLQAEEMAAEEKMKREEMENAVKRLLLKNMASLNLEALSVFHHHLFPETKDEASVFEPVKEANSRIIQSLEASMDVSMSDPNPEVLALTQLIRSQQEQLKQSVDYAPTKSLSSNTGGSPRPTDTPRQTRNFPATSSSVSPGANQAAPSYLWRMDRGRTIEAEEQPRVYAPSPMNLSHNLRAIGTAVPGALKVMSPRSGKSRPGLH